MSAAAASKEALRIAATHGLAKDVNDLLQAKTALLAEKPAPLEKDNTALPQTIPQPAPGNGGAASPGSFSPGASLSPARLCGHPRQQAQRNRLLSKSPAISCFLRSQPVDSEQEANLN